MSKLMLTHKGRTVTVHLPPSGDVEVRLETSPDSPPPELSASTMGLYRFLLERYVPKSGHSMMVNISPKTFERMTGLSTVAVGRSLSELERANLLEVVHKERVERSKIVSYRLLIHPSQTEYNYKGLPTLAELCDWIKAQHSPRHAEFFMTLAQSASDDGTVTFHAGLDEDHELLLPSLEHHSWVMVLSESPMIVKVLGLQSISLEA